MFQTHKHRNKQGHGTYKDLDPSYCLQFLPSNHHVLSHAVGLRLDSHIQRCFFKQIQLKKKEDIDSQRKTK